MWRSQCLFVLVLGDKVGGGMITMGALAAKALYQSMKGSLSESN
jgi:hypothetical protein